MLKGLLDKDKREDLKEKIEVVFAVVTIVSFISHRISKQREEEEAGEEMEQAS